MISFIGIHKKGFLWAITFTVNVIMTDSGHMMQGIMRTFHAFWCLVVTAFFLNEWTDGWTDGLTDGWMPKNLSVRP